MQCVTISTAKSGRHAENIFDDEVAIYVQQRMNHEIGFECSVPDIVGTLPRRIARCSISKNPQFPPEESMMKRNPKKLFLDLGIILSVALCFLSAFLVLYYSSHQQVQTGADHPAGTVGDQVHPVLSKSLSPDSEVKDIAHQKMLAEALMKKPDHVPVLMELARMESDSGNNSEASEYLKKVLNYEPRNIDAKLNLGKQMFELGNTEDAIRLNLEILEVQPLHPDALYNLGAIYGNLGDRDQATLYWNQLISSSPESESGTRAKQMLARM